jgi:thiamine pyrophosphokinase
MDICPNIILGDLDSSHKEVIEFYKKKNVPIKIFPPEKDKTDTQIALEYAIDQGMSQIFIVGALGSRMDHSLANVHLLHFALKKGVDAWIINENNRICLIDKQIDLYKKNGEIVSLLPFTSEVTGVNTQGLYYPLKDGIFKIGEPYGVSNQIINTQGSVSIKSGILIVIQASE